MNSKPAAPVPHSDLVYAVQQWTHFDNLAESHAKQATNARNERANFETRIFSLLDAMKMPNAVLEITGATISRASRVKQTDLSWSFLETGLHAYFDSKGRTDETAAILDFLQSSRGAKSTDYLKKTLLPAAGAGGTLRK
jgi:hypothetical protein